MLNPQPDLTPHDPVTPGDRDRPVLIACDGEPASPESLFNAARLAAHAFGGGIEVVGVCLPTPAVTTGMELMPPPNGYDEERQATMRENITRALSVSAHGDRHWPVRVRCGTPPRELAEEAAARSASLLVMGIGRHNPLDRLFGTETTLSTMRESPVPVLAVSAQFPAAPRRAVTGMDFSPASVHAAHLALQLLDAGGHLTLVHVRPKFEHPTADWQEWDTEYGKTLPPLFEQLLERLHAPSTITVDTVTVRGDPAPALIAYAQQVSADLIAIGSQAHSLVERLMVGSVATRILRTAQCAVLAVPYAAVPSLEHPNIQVPSGVPLHVSDKGPQIMHE